MSRIFFILVRRSNVSHQDCRLWVEIFTIRTKLISENYRKKHSIDYLPMPKL
jgi:hypothetical protein